jgi:hypothetical protein
MRHETNSSYPSTIDPNVQPETYLLLPSFRLKPELELTTRESSEPHLGMQAKALRADTALWRGLFEDLPQHLEQVINNPSIPAGAAGSQWGDWGPSGAAARLGMKRTRLQSRMKKLGISRRA